MSIPWYDDSTEKKTSDCHCTQKNNRADESRKQKQRQKTRR